MCRELGQQNQYRLRKSRHRSVEESRVDWDVKATVRPTGVPGVNANYRRFCNRYRSSRRGTRTGCIGDGQRNEIHYRSCIGVCLELGQQNKYRPRKSRHRSVEEFTVGLGREGNRKTNWSPGRERSTRRFCNRYRSSRPGHSYRLYWRRSA